ncbi:MAG: KOW motif-containing protein, partial [Planctomycetota bacterium]|nr:KOW motif-containing protein [Planctomycetota bacterium]
MLEMTMTDDTWFLVRSTIGVGGFLGTTKPVPMAPHEVERLLSTTSGTSDDKPKLKIDFKKGDTVRIKEGPFENFDGVVEEVTPAKGLVKLTVTIFGRATPVDIEYWLLEKT